MEELLDQMGGWRGLRRGEIVEGVVVRVDQSGVLVSLGGKTEGLVPPSEMRTLPPHARQSLQVGETVYAYVLRPEGENGPALLSLDRASGEKGWRLLQRALETGETLDLPIVGHNKGGLVVDVEGVRGFIPLSQIAPPHKAPADSGLAGRVGERVRCKVLEVNRSRGRAILSEKLAWQEWRTAQKERLLLELQEGEVRRGRVSSLCPFGAFVDLGGADGLIHISELSWAPVRSPEEVVKVGDEVEVYVLKVDRENRRLSLSLKRLLPEPWEETVGKLRVGDVVQGTITRLADFGAFARLEGGVEGLIHISELSERTLRHPREVVKEGDVVPVKVVRIDRERKRLGLSLRQALAEGWAPSPADR